MEMFFPEIYTVKKHFETFEQFQGALPAVMGLPIPGRIAR